MSNSSHSSSKSQKSKDKGQLQSNNHRKDRPMKKSARKYSGCDCEFCGTGSVSQPLETDRRDMDQSRRILRFIHCAQCVREFPEVLRQGECMSLADFQAIEVGYTDVGLQVWCKRHNRNIVHFDFEGVSHPSAVKQAA